MDILKRHEIFEIEALENLKNAKLLDPLVFGGGTMLRLCYELNRYSADLDFWFIKSLALEAYFKKMRDCLSMKYEVTDAQVKFYTLLFEIRSKGYPKRLKIEIRKETRPCDFQERIAFSRYSTKQVILKVHTLEQTMKNKVAAALERREVRDFFDIEFLLKKGAPLTVSGSEAVRLEKEISKFTKTDFSVKLGSALEPEMRRYYIKNGFSFLLGKLVFVK